MIAEPVTIQFPTLYAKQHAAFFGPERIAITEATTKAGKSVGGLVWIQTEAINSDPGSWLWVEPVYALAKVMFERVVRMWTRMDPEKSTGWWFNRSDLYFELPNTSRVYFAGADRPDLIYGRDYMGAVIDEGTRCKDDVWPAVRSTTTSTRGKIRIITNVKGRKNWVYKLARRAEAGEQGMEYHKITAHDAVSAGVIEAAEIEDARRALPEAVFRELYLAEPSDDGGNPFGISAIESCTTPALGPGPAVAWGWDLAKSVDWTVGIALNRLGHVCEFHRFQRSWDDTEHEIVRLSGHANGLVDSTGVGDPIMERLARKTRLEGIKYTSASKQQLMEGLAVALQNGEIQFPDGPIRHELEAFEYEYTRTGVRYSAPDGMHDDCVCALAQAVRAFVSMPRAFAPSEEELAAVTADVEDWRAEVSW